MTPQRAIVTMMRGGEKDCCCKGLPLRRKSSQAAKSFLETAMVMGMIRAKAWRWVMSRKKAPAADGGNAQSLPVSLDTIACTSSTSARKADENSPTSTKKLKLLSGTAAAADDGNNIETKSIFVGHLPWKVSTYWLVSEFVNCGEVESA
jgi:hypothetical protein